MKFSLLSGAYKNAGDFLITNRTIQLLNYVYPNCQIKTYFRNEKLDDKITEINQSDALIFAGGPAYDSNVFPKMIPICDKLSDIAVPVFTLGVGWHGFISSNSYIYKSYSFSQEAKKYISWLEKNSALSCRDWCSVRVLRNNGFQNTVMTGCPAWYDIAHVSSTDLRHNLQIPFKKICISDPGKSFNLNQSLLIVKYVRNKFPEARLVYVFHRGIPIENDTDEKTCKIYSDFISELAKLGVDYKDISSSDKGFKIYDDCDLHIGMRVHAHIYNLSIRNISILVEEDGRGTGVDEALGLGSIKSYDQDLRHFYKPEHIKIDKYIWKFTRFITKEYLIERENPYLINQIDDYLYMLRQSDYLMMKQAFMRMKWHFDTMIKYIESIDKGVKQ